VSRLVAEFKYLRKEVISYFTKISRRSSFAI